MCAIDVTYRRVGYWYCPRMRVGNGSSLNRLRRTLVLSRGRATRKSERHHGQAHGNAADESVGCPVKGTLLQDQWPDPEN
jgi:hypothetical protein